MPKAADIGSKRLISLAPTAWVRWLLHDPTLEAVDLLSADFQWVSRESDALVRVWSPVLGEFLVLNEIQLRYRLPVPRRMRAYTGLAEERYGLPVVPVLVNILEPAPPVEIPTRYYSEFLGLQARQDYLVLNLWEVEAAQVLEQGLLPLLPFTPTLKGGAEERVVRQALTMLRASEELRELETLLAFFASFVMDTGLVQQIMRWDMAVLRESPWYTEIYQEGVEQGIQQGVEQGIQQGVELGVERGRREAALQQLLSILAYRFGPVPENLREQLAGLETERLLSASLLNTVLDAGSLDELREYLLSNGTSAGRSAA